MGKSYYMELIRFLLIVILVFTFACSKNKQCIPDECAANDSIEQVSEYVYEFIGQSQEMDEQYFLSVDNGIVYLLFDLNLRGLYNDKYSGQYDNFDSFKKKIIASPEEFSFDTITIQKDTFGYYEKKFVKNESIMKYYWQHDIAQFKKKYLIFDKRAVDERKRLKFKMSYSYDESLTIAYCMWLSGYIYKWDCMSSEVWFEEVSMGDFQDRNQ